MCPLLLKDKLIRGMRTYYEMEKYGCDLQAYLSKSIVLLFLPGKD